MWGLQMLFSFAYIGSGSYWAAACPLFGPYELWLSGPPTLSPILNITYYISAVFIAIAKYKVLTSTSIESGTSY